MMGREFALRLLYLLAWTGSALSSSDSYDYVVAGGGASGIIAAERLAESGKSVLLLERGPAATFAQGGKYLAPWNDTITQYDVPGLSWALRWVNDPPGYCTDTPAPTACLLGGNTMINGLAFVRPPSFDFNPYPEGWNWPDVRAAADRLYRRNPATLIGSTDGQLSDFKMYEILAGWLKESGYSSVDILSEPDRKEKIFSLPTWDIQNGLRAGPVTSYLPLAQKLDNFKLFLNTKVVRAVRNGSTVTGVEVEDEGKPDTRRIINLNENGKLILAAGALSTPRILFNSGIGPSNQIKTVQSGSTNVTLPAEADWIDLPVGEKVKDHPIIELLFKVQNASLSSTLTKLEEAGTEVVEDFRKGTGLMTQSYQRLNLWTTVENADGHKSYIQGSCMNSADDVISVRLILCHGQTSVGRIGIAGNGTTTVEESPLLRDETDQKAMESAIDTMLGHARRHGSNLMYVTSINATATNDTIQGADLLGQARSGAHWMGGANLRSVVDVNTKVYGTENLFIVDATIHPDIPTGNTQAMVMIGAEVATEKILALDGLSIAPQ